MWQIASTTGWTAHYIKWGIPYLELMMMIADAPRMIEVDPNRSDDKSTAGIFQTMLNNSQR